MKERDRLAYLAAGCECEMCTADPAVETELTVEDTE